MNPFQPPKLRDDLPRYPTVSQLVRVTGATVPGPMGGLSAGAGTGNVPPPYLYVAATQQSRTDTISPRDREPCLVDDVNGQGLPAGYYIGRLANSYNGLPVYEVVGSYGTINNISLGSALFGSGIFNFPPGSTYNFFSDTFNISVSVLNFYSDIFNYYGSVFNYYNDTLNFYTDIFNFFSDTFNYYTSVINYFGPTYFNFYGNTYYTIENNSWIIYTTVTGGSDVVGVIYNIPVEICAYLFWCCTVWDLSSASQFDNAELPAVGSPDTGAVVYDIDSSAGTILTGITPQGMGPQLNIGPVLNATNADPIVLTVAGWTTEPSIGKIVSVKNINGNTAANGVFQVSSSTATTVTLTPSAGNAPFVASPNSAVQFVGPQVVVLVNVGTGNVTLNNEDNSSDGWAQFRLPPVWQNGPGNSITLHQDDSIILWWDQCTDFSWKTLAYTPALTTVNTDNTYELFEITNTIKANNDLGSSMFGRIHFKSDPTKNTNQLDWQGQKVFTQAGGVGPEPDLTFSGAGCTGSITASIKVTATDDPADKTILVSIGTIGMNGTQTIVTGASFNAVTCVLTVTTATMVINCGLIESIS